ncbi:MAG: LysM peptidoglycan-binding domain-containing protein, partial [Candidatus Omnitrophota bacterium]
MLARKNMHYTALVISLYLVNLPLNFANLGVFFRNWFYNFLDVAFYAGAVLSVVELIRYVKANSTRRYLAVSTPIERLPHKLANRTMAAVWLGLVLQEVMSKYDSTRSLIEMVYWRQLTYDPFDIAAYTAGLAVLFILANSNAGLELARPSSSPLLTTLTPSTPASELVRPSGPVGAAVTTRLASSSVVISSKLSLEKIEYFRGQAAALEYAHSSGDYARLREAAFAVLKEIRHWAREGRDSDLGILGRTFTIGYPHQDVDIANKIGALIGFIDLFGSLSEAERKSTSLETGIRTTFAAAIQVISNIIKILGYSGELSAVTHDTSFGKELLLDCNVTTRILNGAVSSSPNSNAGVEAVMFLVGLELARRRFREQIRQELAARGAEDQKKTGEQPARRRPVFTDEKRNKWSRRTLGLPEDPLTLKELKEAWRQKVQETHPDRTQSDDNKRFRLVQGAYEYLKGRISSSSPVASNQSGAQTTVIRVIGVYTPDNKHRLSIPQPLLEKLRDGFEIAWESKEYIVLIPNNEFSDYRASREVVIVMGESRKLDKSNRVLLDAGLADLTGLGNGGKLVIAVVQRGNQAERIEIWPKEAFVAYAHSIREPASTSKPVLTREEIADLLMEPAKESSSPLGAAVTTRLSSSPLENSVAGVEEILGIYIEIIRGVLEDFVANKANNPQYSNAAEAFFRRYIKNECPKVLGEVLSVVRRLRNLLSDLGDQDAGVGRLLMEKSEPRNIIDLPVSPDGEIRSSLGQVRVVQGLSIYDMLSLMVEEINGALFKLAGSSQPKIVITPVLIFILRTCNEVKELIGSRTGKSSSPLGAAVTTTTNSTPALELMGKGISKYWPYLLRDISISAFALHSIPALLGLIPAGIIHSLVSLIAAPVFVFLAAAYVLFDIHLIKNNLKPAVLSMPQRKGLLNSSLLFALDENNNGGASGSHYGLKDYYNFFRDNPLRLVYLPLAGGLIGLSFSFGWPLFVKGAIAALLMPYLYKVTEEFFGREIKGNILRAQAVKEMDLSRENNKLHALAAFYREELGNAPLALRLSYYLPRAAVIFLRYNFPVLVGVSAFARSRLAIAFVSGVAGQAIFPMILPAEIAATSVLSLMGLSSLVPLLSSLHLPHTVVSLLSTGLLVVNLKIIDLFRYRNILQDIYASRNLGLNSFTIGALTQKKGAAGLDGDEKKVAAYLRGRPVQRKTASGRYTAPLLDSLKYYVSFDAAALAAILTSPLSPALSRLSGVSPYFLVYRHLGFWRSFLYMSTISAEIGAVVSSSHALAEHPVFGIVGKPLYRVVEALEINALSWGQDLIHVVENNTGIDFPQAVHMAIGGKEEVRSWWNKVRQIEMSTEMSGVILASANQAVKNVYNDPGLRMLAEKNNVDFEQLFFLALELTPRMDNDSGVIHVDEKALRDIAGRLLAHWAAANKGKNSAAAQPADSRDPAKPREAKTASQVAQRFNELKQDDFAGFIPVTGREPWVKEAMRYLKQHSPTQLTMLRYLVDSGRLRAGPDSEEVFYGANGLDDAGKRVILIAANNNAHKAACLIHELSALLEKPHYANLIEEYAFRLWQVKNEISWRAGLFLGSLKNFIPRVRKELFAAAFYLVTALAAFNPMGASLAMAGEPPAIASLAYATYKVGQGDCLFGIWGKYKESYSWPEFLAVVRKLNPSIQGADLIYPGQQIRISAAAPKDAQPVSAADPEPAKTALAAAYTVNKGDTLSAIARRFNIKLQDLIAANESVRANPNMIRVGQALNIPSTGAQQPQAARAYAPNPDSARKQQTLEKEFEKIKRGIAAPGDNDEGNRAEYLREKTAGDMWKKIQEILYLVDNNVMFVVGSAKREDTHAILRQANSLKDFIKIISDPETSVRIYKIPYHPDSVVDYSGIKSWDEVTDTLKMKQYDEERRSLAVYIKGRDDKGEFEGILWAGVKAQKAYLELIKSGARDRDFTGNILRVLDMDDKDAQRALIKELFPDALLPETNDYLFVAAVVERNAWSGIKKVARFLQASDVQTERQVMPFPHEAIYVKGERGQKQYLKYWPYKLDQVLKTFSIKLPAELLREHDLREGAATTDRYLDSDGDPLTRGEVIFGNNYNKIEHLKLALLTYIKEREDWSLKQNQQYLKNKMLLEFIIAPVNAAIGVAAPAAFGAWASLGTAASRLMFDLVNRPDQKLPGAPSAAERQAFFARFLYMEHLEKTTGKSYLDPKGREYLDKSVAEAKDEDLGPYRKAADGRLKGLLTREDVIKLDYYLNRRKNEATSLFVLNAVNLLMSIGAEALAQDKVKVVTNDFKGSAQIIYSEPRYKALVDVLRGKYISLTGEINIPQVSALIAQGKGLPTVSLGEFSSTPSLLTRFFSIVGITVDAKSVFNAVYKAFSSPERADNTLFTTAPDSVRVNLYLFGFPISLIFDKLMVDDIVRINEDKNFFAYEISNGLFRSKAVAYDETEFFMQPKLAGISRIPLGQIKIAGMEQNVPVYMFLDEKPTGERQYRVFILTRSGLAYFRRQVEVDMDNYGNYAKGMMEGGYVKNVSPLAGTYFQNLASGFFESHDRQGDIYWPSSYGWDMAFIAHRAILSQDMDLARSVLDLYSDYYNTRTKNGRAFDGFRIANHAYTGEPSGAPDIATTAALGQVIMLYEYNTGDKKYSHMLKPIADWLLDMQENYGDGGLRQIPQTPEQKQDPSLIQKYAEPNAVAYAFLRNYGSRYDNPIFGRSDYLEASDKILGWVKSALWDADKGLIRHGEGEKEYSADAQTRWIMVLGPRKFMQEFDMAPEQFWAYLMRVKDTFGVRLDFSGLDGRFVRGVDLLDMACPEVAARKRGLEKGEVVRAGFPEVTSEWVGALKEARKAFLELGKKDLSAQAQDLIQRYTQGLKKLVGAGHTLPLATKRGVLTGFGGYTPLGDKSLGPIAQYDISVVSGDNMWTMLSEGITLPKIARPVKALSKDEIMHPQVVAGNKARDEEMKRVSLLIEKKNLRAKKDAEALTLQEAGRLEELEKAPGEIIYYNKFNTQEAIYRDEEGRKIRIVAIPSVMEIKEHLSRTLRNDQDTATLAAAYRGKRAAVFTRLEAADASLNAGRPIEDKAGRIVRGPETFGQVMKLIRQLPVPEQALIRYKNFANFVLTIDADGDGKPEKVLCTLIFPLGKDIRDEWANPLSGKPEVEVYRDSLVNVAVTDKRITVFDYDNYKVESASRTYPNPYGDRNKFLAAYKTIDAIRAYTLGLTAIEGTSTIWNKFIDPHSIKINPYDPLIEKLKVNYVTGAITRETYGLFPQPVKIVDDQYITEIKYNKFGLFISSLDYNNGKSGRDFERPRIDKVRHPVRGKQRFKAVSAIPEKKLAELRDLSGYGYKNTVIRKDLARGLTETRVFDNANFGNIINKSYKDSADDKDSGVKWDLETRLKNEYYGDLDKTTREKLQAKDLDKLFEYIPYITTKTSTETGSFISRAVTIGYDPLTRKLTAQVTDYTGKVTLETFDYRWTVPVRSETKDSFGKEWVVESTINREETNITSEKSREGKLAVTSASTYDSSAKIWDKEDQLRYDQYGKNNKPLVEKSRLSAFGNLIYRDSIYADGINRRYIPGYDKDGKEVSGRGDKYNTETKKWEPELAYFAYTWNKGDLTRSKTEIMRGNKKTTEAFSEGRPKEEIPITLELKGQKGEVIGSAYLQVEFTYDGSNRLGCPLIADSGATKIVVTMDGRGPQSLDWVDSQTDNLQNGLITIKLHDGLRHLTWYENKDITRRNRPDYSKKYFDSDGKTVAKEDAEWTVAQTVKSEYDDKAILPFTFYDLPASGYVINEYRVISYNPATGELNVKQEQDPQHYKDSRAIKYDPGTGELITQIQNNYFHRYFREVKDKYDRLSRVINGDLDSQGNFIPEEESVFKHDGIPGIISVVLTGASVPVSSRATSKVAQEDRLKLVDRKTRLLGNDGEGIDINSLDDTRSRLFDEGGRIRFESKAAYSIDGKIAQPLITNVINNNLGNPEEVISYSQDDKGKYAPVSDVNSFYEYGKDKYGQYDTIEASVMVLFSEGQKRYIHSVSNNVNLNPTGYLEFKTKKGLEIGADGNIAARTDLDYEPLRKNYRNLPGFTTVSSYKEILDNYGRAEVVLSGYPRIGKDGFFDRNSAPKWIERRIYSLFKYIPISIGSCTYEYNKAKGEDSNRYGNSDWKARADLLEIDKKGNLLSTLHDTRKTRENSREMLVMPDGRLSKMVYDYVRHRLANIYPIIEGRVTIYYDLLERPTEGRDETGQLIKVIIKIEYDKEKGQIHTVREKEPIVGEQWETVIYNFEVSGEPGNPMKVKDVIGDFVKEVKDNQYCVLGKVNILGFAIPVYGLFVIAAIITSVFIILKYFGQFMHWTAKQKEKRIVINTDHKIDISDDSTLEGQIARILDSIGAGPSQSENYVSERLVSLIRNNPSKPYRALFSETVKSLKEWQKKTGNKGTIEDGLVFIIVAEYVSQEMNREGAALIGYSPALFMYLINKAIKLYSEEDARGSIANEIRNVVDAVAALLKQEFGKRVINRDQVSYDDIIDLFEDKEFLEEFDGASDKAGYLTQNGLKLKSKTKFKDNIGYRTFINNLAPVIWLPLIFVEVLLSGAMLQVMDLVKISYTEVILVSFGSSLIYLMYHAIKFGLKNKIDRVSFWEMARFTVFFLLNNILWSVFNWLIGIETWKVTFALFELGIGWGVYLGAPVLVLGISFVILSLFTFPKLIAGLFTFYQGKKEGVGQVKYWYQAVAKFEKARERFIKLMIPKEARREHQGKEREVWIKYWGMTIERLSRMYKLSQKEKEGLLRGDLSKAPKDKEAREAIQDLIGSWLMNMPYAPYWYSLPSFTALITAFDEDVSYPFDFLNAHESGGKITRINHLIRVYALQWERMAETVQDESIEKKLKAHAKAVLKGNFLIKLPSDLPKEIKTMVEEWAENRMVPVAKTVREVALIREAFLFIAWINFPKMSDAELGKLVDEKIQILFIYEGYPLSFVPEVKREAVNQLMKDYPFLEVWWRGNDGRTGLHRYNDDKKQIEEIGAAPYGDPICKGKAFGQNAPLPFVRGEKILFFDSNASVRIEEAVKIPMGLAEFNKDPRLKLVLFGEEIYNEPYSWTTQAFGLGDATWTNEYQRFLNMFGACGFYGHSAIIDREALINAGGIVHRYSGEDTMLSIRFWLKQYRTTHKEYLHLGKSREAWFPGAIVPTGRWSQNTAEYALSRWGYRILRSDKAHIGQKVFNVDAWSFYYKKPLIPLVNLIYLGWIVFLGVSGFVNFKLIILMGLVGLLFNQGVSAPAWVYLGLRKGFIKGIITFISLFPKIHAFFTPLIPNYAVRFHNATNQGQGGFAISGRGFGLIHLSFKEIYGDESKKAFGLPLTFVLQLIATLVSLSLTFIPIGLVQLVGIFMLSIGLYLIWIGSIGLVEYFRNTLWPKDASKRSAIKLQIFFGIPLIAAVLRGFWAWGGIPTYWPYWSLILAGIGFYYIGSFCRNPWVKKTLTPLGFIGSLTVTLWAGIEVNPIFILFAFSATYILTGFATVLTPLLGHARPLSGMMPSWLKNVEIKKKSSSPLLDNIMQKSSSPVAQPILPGLNWGFAVMTTKGVSSPVETNIASVYALSVEAFNRELSGPLPSADVIIFSAG